VILLILCHLSAGGEIVDSIHFGWTEDGTGLLGSIGGMVFDDLNGDGVKDYVTLTQEATEEEAWSGTISDSGGQSSSFRLYTVRHGIPQLIRSFLWTSTSITFETADC